MMRLWFRTMTMLAAAIVVTVFSTSAHATPILVNGNFDSSTNGPGNLSGGTSLTGWSSSGYNFLYDSTGTAGTNGVNLWGPAHGGVANGLGASPTGGNFVGMDGAYQTGPLYQLVTGLTAGESVAVSFWYAGAQQYNFNGNTSEAFNVYFGQSQSNNTSFETPVLQDMSHGFTGWQHQTFTFTADGASDYLAFLAVGTPAGEPPFSLLDGVTVSDTPVIAATPEPTSLVLLATGLMGTAGMLRRRYRAAA